MSKPYRAFVVLTDNEIEALFKDGQAIKAFPFLVAAKQRKQHLDGCATCQKSKALADYQQELKETRRRIAIMPDADKQKLLGILNAKAFRVFYYEVGANGAKVRKPLNYPGD